ncbi:unnamed protein product [Debaryomyces tyrocola]|nr:unnamed protein product [Debaryomyces tyrocola]
MKPTFLKCLQGIDKNHAYKQINIIDIHSRYLIINKPSGIQCNGTKSHSNYLLPQLYKQLKAHFSADNPNYKLNPDQYKVAHRLDKYVSGGLIIARGKNVNAFRKSFSNQNTNLSVTRKYIALIPIPNTVSFKQYLHKFGDLKVQHESEVRHLNCPESVTDKKGLIFKDDLLAEGIINFDIVALPKDDRRNKNTGELVTYNALTKFKILHSMFHVPTIEQISRFPKLYKNKTIYPIIIELQTGRKNQIRDHILQAFKVSLLNDDKFIDFKMVQKSNTANINSEVYNSNQIGLHSAYISILKSSFANEYVIPIPEGDEYLWKGFLDEKSFIETINHELINF